MYIEYVRVMYQAAGLARCDFQFFYRRDDFLHVFIWGGADIYCEEDLNSYDGRWTVTNVFDPIEHINKDTAYYSVWSTVCIRQNKFGMLKKNELFDDLMINT